MAKFRPKFRPGVAGKSNRQRLREADNAMRVAGKAWVAFMATLAQSGGEITVTQGTLDQVKQNIRALNYDFTTGKNPGEFVIRLIDGSAPVEGQGVALETTHVHDEHCDEYCGHEHVCVHDELCEHEHDGGPVHGTEI